MVSPVNSSNSTTLEEGQKIWDEIDIDYVKIRNAKVRNNKGYYELKINVKEPGNSAFDKDITVRWLYIFYSKKVIVGLQRDLCLVVNQMKADRILFMVVNTNIIKPISRDYSLLIGSFTFSYKVITSSLFFPSAIL